MSRVLVAGLCPLPFENVLQSFGPGIRTWQFAWSLARAGHEVRVLAMMTPGAYGNESHEPFETRHGVAIERLADVAFLDPATIRKTIRAFRPEALAGASLYGSAALARADVRLPFWADQFGHVMAEAQAKAAVEEHDWPVAHAWGLLRPVLQLADRMSVVSERQRYAAIGELGAIGRLTAETSGFEFIAVIPCALVPPEEGPPWLETSGERLVRGRIVPEDAFVVLWSGGFNVWSDVETVARGLEGAMSCDPRIHFVSTGGPIRGLDSRTYERFEQMVAGSPHRARFHLEGWVRAERVRAYVAEADVGLLTDRPIYEGLLGSKNRIVQWAGAGLPPIYNRLGDIGDLLEEHQLGLTFAPGDAQALAERLLWAAHHKDALLEIGARARDFAWRALTFEYTTRELVSWAAAPRFAPDVDQRRHLRGPGDHATLRQRIATHARRVPVLRRSDRLVRLWRRLLGSRR